MKNTFRLISGAHFRSVDDWKSALMTLPDTSFFELLRSILGNIKTPFSKQRLLDDLYNFLTRDEIRKTIAAYITGHDQKIIAAVALLCEPLPEEMEAFFAGEFSSEELHAMIINLEERLIIYRLRVSDTKNQTVPDRKSAGSKESEGVLRLALNPVLQQILVPFIADTESFFVSYKDEDNDNTERGTVPDDRTMAALFSFIWNEKGLFKADNLSEVRGQEGRGTESNGTMFRKIRKKALDDGKRIFPAMDLDLVVRILLKLGLFRQENQSFFPCREKIESYCGLSAVERQEYWAAGVYSCFSETDSAGGGLEESHGPWYSWARIKWITSFIHRFRDLLTPGRKYPEITLRRLGDLLQKEDTSHISTLYSNTVQFPFNDFLALMKKTGLMVKTGDFWKLPPAAPSSSAAGEVPEKPVIAMDTAFSFVLYPEISFANAMELGVFCSVKESAGTAIHFEITRQSAARGFDEGKKADGMVSLLERLSHNRLDSNLSWTLKEWESRYMGVSLHEGIVLNLSEDRRYLAEAKPVSKLIRKTMAPGVYLLFAEDKSEAVRALMKAGVDIVAQPPLDQVIDQRNERSGSSRTSFSGLSSSNLASLSFARIEEEEAGENTRQEEADSIREKFRQALKKMQLSKQERDELFARIERRLILSEAQLEGTSLRYEKLEARGLDYPGKSMIAKQAVETGSLVEVSWPGMGGETSRTIGIPQALEKQEGDSILVLRTGGDSGNADRVFRVPLGKISLLRRIKQSIFGE